MEISCPSLIHEGVGEVTTEIRSAAQRRDELLEWLQEKAEHQGLTTRQIVDVSGVYDRPEYCGWLGSPISRATRDLNSLLVAGHVKRVVFARLARWELPDGPDSPKQKTPPISEAAIKAVEEVLDPGDFAQAVRDGYNPCSLAGDAIQAFLAAEPQVAQAPAVPRDEAAIKAAAKARALLDAVDTDEANYNASRELMDGAYEGLDLIDAALRGEATQPSEETGICGVVCNCGPNREPLACGFEPHDDGPHSWASLPTWTERWTIFHTPPKLSGDGKRVLKDGSFGIQGPATNGAQVVYGVAMDRGVPALERTADAH